MYFLYRPRVNVDHPTGINDIQRFFMILAPTSRPKASFRLLIIGKKRLPIADRHERFFGFVEATAGTWIIAPCKCSIYLPGLKQSYLLGCQ